MTVWCLVPKSQLLLTMHTCYSTVSFLCHGDLLLLWADVTFPSWWAFQLFQPPHVISSSLPVLLQHNFPPCRDVTNHTSDCKDYRTILLTKQTPDCLSRKGMMKPHWYLHFSDVQGWHWGSILVGCFLLFGSLIFLALRSFAFGGATTQLPNKSHRVLFLLVNALFYLYFSSGII